MEKHESCLPEIELMVGCQQFIILKIGILGQDASELVTPSILLMIILIWLLSY